MRHCHKLVHGLGFEIVDIGIAVGDASEDHDLPLTGGHIPGDFTAGRLVGEIDAAPVFHIHGHDAHQLARRKLGCKITGPRDIFLVLVESFYRVGGMFVGETLDAVAVNRARAAAGKAVFVIDAHRHAQFLRLAQGRAVDLEIFFAEILGLETFTERQYTETAVAALVTRVAHLLDHSGFGNGRIVPEPQGTCCVFKRRVGKLGPFIVGLCVRCGCCHGDKRKNGEEKESSEQLLEFSWYISYKRQVGRSKDDVSGK